MKWKIVILAALSVMVAGADEKTRCAAAPAATKKAAAKKNAAPPAELTLPAGAVQASSGTYTFTDAKGTKWIYRQTPFGLTRSEEKTGQAAAAPVSAGVITATEDGDKIRFERPGPFGVYRWEKKKSELEDDERAAWERSKARQE